MGDPRVCDVLERFFLERAAAPSELVEWRAGGSLHALEHARQNALIEVNKTDEGWQIAFRHPPIRPALYDDIGPATRSGLYTLAAAILGPATSLAHHLAAADGPDPELVTLLTEQANEELHHDNPRRAADHLLAAARVSPPGPAQDRLMLDGVELLLQAGEVTEALGYTNRLEAMPEQSQCRLVRARMAWMLGRIAEAEELAAGAWDQAA